jgi:hypothetical protein
MGALFNVVLTPIFNERLQILSTTKDSLAAEEIKMLSATLSNSKSFLMLCDIHRSILT